jgi:hypothetical protein
MAGRIKKALIAINVGGSSGEPVEAETGCVAQRR